MDFEYRWTRYEDRDVQVPIPTYPYRLCHASNREFRLLEILPRSSPEDQARLECKLHHHSLDDHQAFVALSYECGDPSQYRRISVDDNVFPVALNLYDALHRLRAPNCPLVWVDAICIHQNDPAEKAEHILMMKDIYHYATNVAVWLGKAGFGSDNVMDMLYTIDRSRDPSRSNGQAPWTPNWQQLQDIRPELVAFLHSRTYWQRAWIVQEVAMGSKVVLFCGDRSVGWRGLEQLVDQIVKINAFPDISMRHVDHLCWMRSNRIKGIPVGLLEALCRGSESKALMLQDKVYALLGLVFDQTAFVPRIDYTWRPEKMSTELTKSWILSRKSLDIILAGGANNRIGPAHFPTWMPNYLSMSSSHILRRLSSYIAGQDVRYRCGDSCAKWSTSASSVADRSDWEITDRGQLYVRGICVGTINGLGATLDSNSEPVNGPRAMWKGDRPKKALEETIRGSLALYDKKYEDSLHEPRFLEYLFNFDSMVHGFWKSQDLKASFNKVVEWRDRNRNFEVRGKRLRTRSRTAASTIVQVNAWMTAAKFAIFVAELTLKILKVPVKVPQPGLIGDGRKQDEVDMTETLRNLSELIDEGLRLMITDYGDMGWAHPAAEIGDKIMLLKGCSVPVVLRPIGTNEGVMAYQVIGHAYCHGFMWGEAWLIVGEQNLEQMVLQ